jgi:hypothetical protein
MAHLVHVQYSHLYRVLRDDENALLNGISAKYPNATLTVEKHVDKGSYYASQYISTSATSAAAEDFAKGGYKYTPGSKWIAIINTSKIPPGTVEYADLTIPHVLNSFIPTCNEWAQNCARKFQEVIIKGHIPANCIDKVYNI